MSRSRGKLAGGYVRKTISLPASVMETIEAYLERVPGLTISALLTDAAIEYIKKYPQRKIRA